MKGITRFVVEPSWHWCQLLCVLLISLSGPHDAFAEGWKTQLHGVKAVGLGYSSRALAEDATTVWFNPAGMSELDLKWSITFGGAFLPFALDYTDRGSRSLLGQPLTGASSTNGGRTATVPHVYVVRKLSNRWWAGMGLSFPYGLEHDYKRAWVGRYHATKTKLQVASLNPAVAIKATETLALGIGLDLQRSTVTLANVLDFGSLGAALGLPLAPQANDGAIELKAADWAIGYALSLAWQVTPRVRFASTYRSQVEHTLQGTARFEVPPAAGVFTAGGAFGTTSATATLPMPHELSGSLAYRLERHVGCRRRPHVDRLEPVRATYRQV